MLTRTQVLDHPQVLANDLLSHYDHPQAGQLRQARAPSRFSAAPEQHWQGAPRLGEQTGELLAECGYSAEEIQAMCDSGIAAAPAK